MKGQVVYFVFALFVASLAWDDSQWQMVWSDEFNGNSLDPNSWSYDIGGGGYGNNEVPSPFLKKLVGILHQFQ
jgi:hypothetical protein